MTGEAFVTVLALVGVVIVVAALFSGFIERSNVPQVAVFLALGAVLGPAGLGLVNINLQSSELRVVATLSLALVLFTDAVTLNVNEVRRNAGLALRVLGPGTILSAVIIAVLAWLLLGVHPAAAAILGAALASTDPVLLRGLLRRPEMPSSAKQALRLESGMNDVVLLPVVLVAMSFLPSAAGGAAGPDWAALVLDLFILGPGAGVAIGVIAVSTLDLVRRRIGVRRDYEALYSLGVAFTAFAAAEAVHGSGFLAVFAAGLTISWLDVELCDCFLEYGETTSELALLFAFVLLGSSLIWDGLSILSVATLPFAVLVLLARPAPFFLSLIGTKLKGKEKFLIAWFGPRGLSTILLVLLPVFAGVEGSEYMFAICCLVVLLSVTVHGGSLMALGRTIDRKAALRRSEEDAAVLASAEAVAPAVALAVPTATAVLPRPENGSTSHDEHGSSNGVVVQHIETQPLAPTAPEVIEPPRPSDGVAASRAGSEPLTLQPSPRRAAELPEESAERITVEQYQELVNNGESVIVVDARTERTYELGEDIPEGSARVDSQQAVRSATRLNLPKDAWLIVLCA